MIYAMDTFTNLIRRYSPQEVMTELYKLSLKMMENDNKGFLNIPVHLLIKNRGLIKEQITLPVWKISEIVYWSIVKSNDYRNKKLRDSDIIRIINEFYDFDNERTDVSFLKDVRFDEISQFLCGMMGEQEQFQNLQWVINSFNRNYHILIGSKKIQRNLKKSCAQVIQEEVGVDIHAFCTILIMLIGACGKTQAPLEYKDIELLGIKNDDWNKVINYYAADYKEIRNSQLEAQIFYTKPFVKTENPKRILAVTYHLVGFLVANGLYWGIRNYYYKADSQDFLNAFGDMFEDYLVELSEQYLATNEFEHLQHENERITDFRYEFENCIWLVEQKSALLKLNAKSQTPNMKNISIFLNRNIQKAYKQLEATYQRETSTKPVLKFILLYENLQNTQLMQISMPEIFENDSRCFIIGISEFEQLLRIRKEDPMLWEKVIKELLSRKADNVSVTNILNRTEGFQYSDIFIHNNDYVQKYIDEMQDFYQKSAGKIFKTASANQLSNEGV